MAEKSCRTSWRKNAVVVVREVETRELAEGRDAREAAVEARHSIRSRGSHVKFKLVSYPAVVNRTPDQRSFQRPV